MASQIGIKIRAERKKSGLTLDQLAELTQSSKSYIWELENKDGVNPSGEKISKLAEALKVSVEFLLNDNQDQPSDLDSKNVFFRRYEKLSPDKQAAINAVLDALDRESKP
jgi:transcriptional regulator with XRE-family HTH domain